MTNPATPDKDEMRLTEAQEALLKKHAFSLGNFGTRYLPKSPERDALQRHGLIRCDSYRLWRLTDAGRALLSRAT